MLRKRRRPATSRIDQAVQTLPEQVVEHRLVFQRRDQQRAVEARPEHRGVAQHHSVGRSEPVEVRGDHRLDRVGQGGGRPRRADHVEQLEEKQHVAARTSGDLLDVVRLKRMVVGGDLDDLGRLPIGERTERERETAQLVIARGGPGRRRIGVGDDEDIPERAGRPRQTDEQVGARLVHELDVLDGQHRRGAAEGVDEEAQRDVGERVTQEALVEAARLRGRRQVETEQDAEQRHPRLRARGRCARRLRAGGARSHPRPRADRAPAPPGSVREARSTASRTRTPRSGRAAP